MSMCNNFNMGFSYLCESGIMHDSVSSVCSIIHMFYHSRVIWKTEASLTTTDTNFDVSLHSIWFTFKYFWIEIGWLFFHDYGKNCLLREDSTMDQKTWVWTNCVHYECPSVPSVNLLMIFLSEMVTSCGCHVCGLPHFLLQARSKVGPSSWNPQSDDFWNSATMSPSQHSSHKEHQADNHDGTCKPLHHPWWPPSCGWNSKTSTVHRMNQQ